MLLTILVSCKKIDFMHILKNKKKAPVKNKINENIAEVLKKIFATSHKNARNYLNQWKSG